MKPITFYDPVLLSGPIASLRAKILFLETKVAELEAQPSSNFNGTYIQILRDHIRDLNDFIVEYLSEDASGS
jgi:hypothetical protein